MSPARPLSRLGKVGRGRAGISALGEGIPALERRAGALHWLPGRGVSPVPKDWRTLLPPAREPGVGEPAGTARGGACGAGLRLSPSPGFGRSANPTAPPAPPGSRALSARRQRPFGKVCIAAGWSSGPPRRAVSPRLLSGSLQRRGGTASPCPGAGLPGVLTCGAGRTRPRSRRLELAPRPAASRTLGRVPLLQRPKERPIGGGQLGRQLGYGGARRTASWPRAGRR